MLRTYDYKCTCRKITILVEEKERDEQVCETCGSRMQRLFSTPNVRTEKLSMSYVDGQRWNSKEFRELREQHKLEDQMFYAESNEERHEAEIRLNDLTGGKS